MAANPYMDFSIEDLETEIDTEEEEIVGLTVELEAKQRDLAANPYRGYLIEEELAAEISREQDQVELLETALHSKRIDFRRIRYERDASRKRYSYWREERRELRRRLARILGRIRSLESRFRRLEARIFPTVIDRAEMSRLRTEISEGWSEWAAVMNRLRLEVRPHEREAEARYRRGLRRVREEARTLRTDILREERERKKIQSQIELKQEVPRLRREISQLEGQIENVETELELKREALIRYKVVEYTKYFEVIIRRPKRTPSIRFELRGEFTVPYRLSSTDPRVISLIETKLKEAFLEWGKPKKRSWMGPDGRVRTAIFGGIESENFSQPEGPSPVYGEEEMETVEDYEEEVQVTITKYVKGKVEDTWKETVVIRVEEYPLEEEE